jgi:hypothetical protein
MSTSELGFESFNFALTGPPRLAALARRTVLTAFS